jgi:hypothetical protein
MDVWKVLICWHRNWGSSPRYVKFSNSPNTISEWLNMLYLLATWHPESFREKNWPQPAHLARQLLNFSPLTKSSILHAPIFQKPEHMHVSHFKNVLLLYMFETRVQSFRARFWHQVGHRAIYYQGWWTQLPKHPIYLVFLPTRNVSCTFPAKCIWGIKSLGIIITYV